MKEILGDCFIIAFGIFTIAMSIWAQWIDVYYSVYWWDTALEIPLGLVLIWLGIDRVKDDFDRRRRS